MEAEDREPSDRVTIEQACKAFTTDATARGLRESSLEKYVPLFRRLKEFAMQKGLRYLNQLDIETLREFRAAWTARNYTARNELERLRALFRFALDAKWIEDNPATKLKAPRTEDPPAIPFSAEEMQRILKVSETYKGALPLKAFVLVLRHTGLRIRDVVTLARDKVSDGKVFLRTAKTGTQVKIPLPPECLQALENIKSDGAHFFWSGAGLPKTRVANYQLALKTLFTNAGVSGGYAHRFRHTFAAELLMAGVPVERVAVLLGHTNVRVTQRHYSSWIQARQDQLEEDVKRTWAKTG